MSQTIRVLIADDHRVIRDRVSQFIDSQDEFTVVGKAADGAAAVEMAGALQPDVVIMDYNMPEKDGVEATRQILKENPGMVVIGFSLHDDSPVKQEMLKAGAAVYVSKSASSAHLHMAIGEHAGTRA